MSFSVKSSHKFVNPRIADPEYLPAKNKLGQPASGSSVQQTPRQNTNTTDNDYRHPVGSSQGMAMRTTISSMDDVF